MLWSNLLFVSQAHDFKRPNPRINREQKSLKGQPGIRVTGDSQTGRLLGAQILGSWGAEISKRVDIFATALFAGMRVEELDDLDLSYTPPLSSPWDPVQIAAHHWTTAVGSEKMETTCRK
jgi:pyruvate/2-oxoglutarate dehydrogenase complex dihydrolipoamide dehydrogenase (E3) component